MSRKKRPVSARKKKKRAKRTSSIEKRSAFLETHRTLAISCVMGVAFLLRLGFFIQAADDFPASLHKWPDSDMSFFHAWAGRINEGDLLTDTIYHPFHTWHQWIADAYFDKHPGKEAELRQAMGPDANIAHVHLNDWMGNEQFHQEPLYPYFMALVYAVAGSHPQAVFIVQLLLGLLTVYLVFLITERYFGILPAVLAGLLAALAGIFMTYELTLLRAPVVTLFAVLLVFWYQRTLDHPASGNWILLGVFSALALLVKITFILFIAGMAVWFLVSKTFRQNALRHIALGIAGFAVTFSPLIVRNAIVGAPLLSTNSVGAITAISPNLHANKTGEFWVDGAVYADILERTDAGTFGSLIEAVKTHPSVLSYAGSLLQRTSQAFRWRAHTDNVNHVFWRKKFLPLRLAPVGFWFITPLALVGLFFCFYPKIRSNTWPLLIMLLASLAPLVLFYVLERYRLPFLIVMLPLAGYGMYRLIAPGNLRHLLIALAIAAAGTVWSNELFKENRPSPEELIRTVDLVSSFQYHYRPKIDILISDGRFDASLQLINDYRRMMPDYIYTYGPNNKPVEQPKRDLLSYAALLHTFFSEVAAAAGETQEAQRLRRFRDQMNAALQ